MLEGEPSLAAIAPIVRSHHERIDGRGYPDGLAGEQIPLAARIIAVCDALDAMTHEHRFRGAMQTNMALSVLREHAGSQWDAKVIAHVTAVLPSMSNTPGLAEVGRPAPLSSENEIDDNRIPIEDVNELLIAVDAEI